MILQIVSSAHLCIDDRVIYLVSMSDAYFTIETMHLRARDLFERGRGVSGDAKAARAKFSTRDHHAQHPKTLAVSRKHVPKTDAKLNH